MAEEFLRDTWYVAVWSQDLKPGALVARTLLGEPVVVVRRADGSTAALRDICPHRFAPLSMGTLIPGDRIRCAYHGLEYETESGRCVRNPQRGVVPRIATPRYPTVERHGIVWIWMGNPQRADPSLIADFSILDADPANRTRLDYLKMNANYLLIADNLHDLSHTSFLHEGLLANEQMLAAEVSVDEKGDQLNVTRNSTDVPPPDLFRLIYSPDGRHVDINTRVRWDAPGNFIIDSDVNFTGESPDRGTGFVGLHFLTPCDAASTHYHFAAVRKRPENAVSAKDLAAVQAELGRIRRYAFEGQDQPMIEAQQQLIKAFPQLTRTPALLESDRSVARYRRILEGMFERERAAPQQTGEIAARAQS